jgi:hypothetical protein
MDTARLLVIVGSDSGGILIFGTTTLLPIASDRYAMLSNGDVLAGCDHSVD